MRKFFREGGAVFQPWISLHGTRLKEFRHERITGKETVIGEAVLDIGRLRQFRVILTNYETIVNYQHSFAGMNDSWSVVVTDEAQEYKTPNTKISHALKSLAPRFRIACTGTPVETRLMDVWNIFDFLQPGQLLGSAHDFRDQYEKPLEERGPEAIDQVISQLRNRLGFGSDRAFALRRDKSTLTDLPKKFEHILECNLSPEQRERHVDLISRARSGGPENHPFSLISQLMKIYQHPALVPTYQPMAPHEAVAKCPKLERALSCLRDIQKRGEKVLIFTRNLNMQQVADSGARRSRFRNHPGQRSEIKPVTIPG